jgi:ubiquinone biosynthesis protein
MEESRPIFLEILKKRYSPERLGSDLLRRLDRLGALTNTMPDQLSEVLDDLRRGRLSIQASSVDLRDAAHIVGQRLLLGLVVAAALLSAAVLYVNGDELLAALLTALGLLALFVHTLRAVWQGLGRR